MNGNPMKPIMFAMAGIAEAAIAIQIAITWLAIAIIGGLGVVAFFSNRLWVHILVLVIAAVLGLILAPWEVAFISLTAEDRQDPDAVEWFGQLQFLSYACFILAALVIVNFVQYVVRQLTMRNEPAETQQGE